MPIPVSPWIRTTESVGATVSTCFEEVFQGSAPSDDFLEVVLGLDFFFEVDLLAGELVLEGSDLAISERVLHGNRDLRGDMRQQFGRPAR